MCLVRAIHIVLFKFVLTDNRCMFMDKKTPFTNEDSLTLFSDVLLHPYLSLQRCSACEFDLVPLAKTDIKFSGR